MLNIGILLGLDSITNEQVTTKGQVIVKGEVDDIIEAYRKKVLEFCVEPKSSKEIRDYLNIKSKGYTSTYIIKPLIDNGALGYTNLNSVNARNQKYITIKS